MINYIKQFAQYDREKSVISRMVAHTEETYDTPSLLDVGCGFGRNLQYLSRQGIRLVGVDSNIEAVNHNRSLGYECYTPDADEWRIDYDCILMSHIIEHFAPTELFGFIEGYLQYLKPGGQLIIATPLLTDYFFDDFTHIKPYHPESILMIFNDVNPQVSMRSSVKLELRDLWFRTSPYRLRWVRIRYLGTLRKALVRGVNGLLAFLHYASFGLLGRKDGWVGGFERVN